MEANLYLGICQGSMDVCLLVTQCDQVWYGFNVLIAWVALILFIFSSPGWKSHLQKCCHHCGQSQIWRKVMTSQCLINLCLPAGGFALALAFKKNRNLSWETCLFLLLAHYSVPFCHHIGLSASHFCLCLSCFRWKVYCLCVFFHIAYLQIWEKWRCFRFITELV